MRIVTTTRARARAQKHEAGDNSTLLVTGYSLERVHSIYSQISDKAAHRFLVFSVGVRIITGAREHAFSPGLSIGRYNFSFAALR